MSDKPKIEATRLQRFVWSHVSRITKEAATNMLDVKQFYDSETECFEIHWRKSIWGQQRGVITVTRPASLRYHFNEVMWKRYPDALRWLTRRWARASRFFMVKSEIVTYEVRDLFPELKIEAPGCQTVLNVLESRSTLQDLFPELEKDDRFADQKMTMLRDWTGWKRGAE